MQRAKVKVLIALFAYSGNGGIPGTIPELAIWLCDVVGKSKLDDRIETVAIQSFCDTPITMTRNRAIEVAQAGGFDMVLMLDSDNQPDGYLGVDPNAVPFWDTAFDFAYKRLIENKPTVIAAPYCGPPPDPRSFGEGEVPYLFEWMNDRSDDEQFNFRLHRLNRNEAARMTGICPVAALPTGVCLFTLNAFDGLRHPYFDYEFNERHSAKNSTEDVYTTRNISLYWEAQINEPTVFATCSSWALHFKIKKVGRPTLIDPNTVQRDLRDKIVETLSLGMDVQQDIDFTRNATDNPSEVILPSGDDESTPEQPKYRKHYRNLDGLKLAGIGHQTSFADLKKLQEIAFDVTYNTPNPVFIEIGSWVGESAAAIKHTVASLTPNFTIYCVDTFKGTASDSIGEIAQAVGEKEILATFIENIGKDEINNRVKIIKGSSIHVAGGFTDPQNADMIFIDAEHTYEACFNDIQAWWRHLAPGGYMCGHDYCPAFPGVIRAVNTVFETLGLEVSVEPGTSIWLVKKPPLGNSDGHPSGSTS